MNIIESSQKNWSCSGSNGNPTINDIQTGCLQRIATSLESISASLSRLSFAAQALNSERIRAEGSRRRTRKDYRALLARVEKLEGSK